MAEVLSCQEMDLSCDYLCAETTEGLILRASQYAGEARRSSETPSEFEDRVRYFARGIEKCGGNEEASPRRFGKRFRFVKG